MHSSTIIDRTRLLTFLSCLVGSASVAVGIGLITNLHLLELATLYIFTPAIAALVVTMRNNIGLRTVGLRLGYLRWTLAALIVAIVLVLIATGMAILFPGIEPVTTATPIPGIPTTAGAAAIAVYTGYFLISGVLFGTFLGFGEELGWRGYLLWELAPLGFWRATGIIGLSWGIWHAPLVIAGYHFSAFPMLGIAMVILTCLAFAPLFTYLAIRAQSIIAAVLLHGMYGTLGVLIVQFTRPDSPLLDQFVASPVGIAGIIAFGIAALSIVAFDVPELSRDVLYAPIK